MPHKKSSKRQSSPRRRAKGTQYRSSELSPTTNFLFKHFPPDLADDPHTHLCAKPSILPPKKRINEERRAYQQRVLPKMAPFNASVAFALTSQEVKLFIYSMAAIDNHPLKIITEDDLGKFHDKFTGCSPE
jgi:hypothetical protein